MPRKKPVRLPPKKDCHIAQVLLGLFSIIVGTVIIWDPFSPSDIPEWVGMGPAIQIAAESFMAGISVDCHVAADGAVAISLSAGDSLEEPVRVWVTVEDLYFPFQWEVGDAVSNRILSQEDGAGDENYPSNRRFTSQESGLTSGTSHGYLGDLIHIEWFSTVINPEASDRKIWLQMDPEHTEYQNGSNIILRMPQVVSSRSMPALKMTTSDFKDLINAGQYDMLQYFSNCMIDGNASFVPALTMQGDYFSDYTFRPNYILSSIQPDPERLLPDFIWEEKLQWIPYVSFHDINQDWGGLIASWFSGILIAVGSGLVVLPLPGWLQSGRRNRA